MAFFVVEFVLVMQFLWKYINDIIGKGISFGVLMELLFYFAVRMIPEAVPVTILIASVMVFGNLAEKYEISSMKSAGISLTRIMAAGGMLAIMTALFSLLASNYLKPRANYKFLQRLYTVKKQEATLNLEEGVFSYDFRNITINVGKKHKDGEGIEDVLIYDNTGSDKSKINMLSAKTGKMYTSEDNAFFVMDLVDGEQYRELTATDKKESNPFVRTKFEKWSKHFDLSEFNIEATDLSNSRKKYDLLNAKQLLEAIDTFDKKLIINKENNAYNFNELLDIKVNEVKKKSKEDSPLPETISKAIKKKNLQEIENKKSKQKIKKPKKALPKVQSQLARLDSSATLLSTFSRKDQKILMKTAKYISDKSKDLVGKTTREEKNVNYSKARYVLRFHQQFSWALICIVFLFIGAPLGSIVRKGGYGYPLLISIIFFMVFMITSIMGDKLSGTGELNPVIGAWLPNMILIPIAIYISYKALNDSDFKTIQNSIIKIKNRFKREGS